MTSIRKFDIRNIDTKAAAEKGLEFELIWQDEPLGIKISVVGAGSDVFKKHKGVVGGKIATADKRGKPLNDEEKNDLYVRLAANCTKSWKDMVLDGEDVVFSTENALAVYTEFPWIGTQVIAQIYNIVEMVGNVDTTKS